MSKLKVTIPKNESENFRLKSNWDSWKNKKVCFLREQENGIAQFKQNVSNRISKLESLSNHKPKLSRRDDSDFKEYEKEINQYTCLKVVKNSTLIRKGLLQADSSFVALVKDYVLSVRNLGNYCFKCNLPLKVKSAKIVVKDIYNLSACFIFLNCDFLLACLLIISADKQKDFKKENQKFRKTKKVLYKDKDGFHYKMIFFMEKSNVINTQKTETKYYAEIFGCHLITFRPERENKNSEICELSDIAKCSQSLQFIESKPMIIELFSNQVCKCKF